MTTSWESLSGVFAKAIDGRKVTHALFTTYAFDPDFFESVVLRAMIPNTDGISDHRGLCRLQLEALLRETPIEIAVFFDANMEPPAFPWLPYRAVPVMLGKAFHGKVVLLRLLDEKGAVRWLLGAGSANLTEAGWWRNVEVFSFCDDFDPKSPPPQLQPGVLELLEFLGRQIVVGDRVVIDTMLGELSRSHGPSRPNTPSFGVFVPGGTTFCQWLRLMLPPKTKGDTVEVVSPYFPTSGQQELVRQLLDVTQTQRLRLWLPEDPWESATGGGAAVRMEKSQYDGLCEVNAAGKNTLAWCRFSDQLLRKEATPDDVTDRPPRFLHAKVIRVPGGGTFTGSVNFSHEAFNHNFEAGFFWPEADGAWLSPVAEPNAERFLEPMEASPHVGNSAVIVRFAASYHWGNKILCLKVDNPDSSPPLIPPFVISDGSGREIMQMGTTGGEVTVSCPQLGYLEQSLTASAYLAITAIGLECPAKVWVQQDGLEHRPLSAELTLDVWKMLQIWRSLRAGNSGASAAAWEIVRAVILAAGDVEEVEPLPVAEAPQDVFEEMATIHSGMHLLRSRLQRSTDERTLRYYLSAERPDTIASLLKQLEQREPGEAGPDAVQRWVLLHWVKLIAADWPEHEAARGLGETAGRLLQDLNKNPILQPFQNAENRRWLEWVSEKFLEGRGI